jgi:DNA repair exonuclease SbcCD ATPase subunit
MDKFIFLNDSGKKDEILKLLDMEKLNKLKEGLTSQIKSLEKQIASAKTEVATTSSNIEMVSKFLADNTGYEDLLDQVKIELKQLLLDLEGYQEVARRLGILPEAGVRDLKGPEAVQ